MLFGLAKYIAPANATHAAIMPTVPSNACSPSGKDPSVHSPSVHASCASLRISISLFIAELWLKMHSHRSQSPMVAVVSVQRRDKAPFRTFLCLFNTLATSPSLWHPHGAGAARKAAGELCDGVVVVGGRASDRCFVRAVPWQAGLREDEDPATFSD